MGAWGHGLFQSDADLDVQGDISDEAGRLTNDPDFTLWYPDNRDHVVEKLNAGLFHQLLENFRAKNWKHGVIYLGALSMQLGVKIAEGDLLVLKETLSRVSMYDEAKEQMRKGLEGYKSDGEAWDFNSPGVHETMERLPPLDTKASGNKGFTMINVPQDFSKMPTPMPKEGEVEEDGVGEMGAAAEGGTQSKEATGTDALGDKAKLKAWFLF